jgi:hypothetical protein
MSAATSEFVTELEAQQPAGGPHSTCRSDVGKDELRSDLIARISVEAKADRRVAVVL